MTYEVSMWDSSGNRVRQRGFRDVSDARDSIADAFCTYMSNWPEIDEDGLTVTAEISREGEDGFSDMYELRCGI